MRAVVILLAVCAGCVSTTGSSDSSTGTGSSSGSSSTSTTSSSSGGSASSRRPDGGVDADGGVITQSLIAGRVLSPSGTFGLFDALVSAEWIENGVERHRQTHTRHDGTFSLRGLPAGAYTLVARRGQYEGMTTATLEHELAQLDEVDIIVSGAGVRFEVVNGAYDDIGAIVSGLGFSPVEIDGEEDFLNLDEPPAWVDAITDDDTLMNAHAIFLNCGIDDDIWMLPGLEMKRQKLLDYVAGGRSIYISDWSYDIMEWLLPDALGFYGDDGIHDEAQEGRSEIVLAGIGDQTLEKLVGRSVRIEYDLGNWALLETVDANPADGGPRVDVLARATVHTIGGAPLDEVPLAVVVHHGQGRIIYTTFHNEAQLDATVLSILRYMVLSL